MGFFQNLCRNTGLMIHNVIQPLRDDAKASKQEVRRKVEEEKVSPTVTLRRTTIEEIEVRQDRADQ